MSDVDEIRNLLGRYCHHLDASGENAQLASLFAEDGEFVLLGQTHVGRAAIQALFDMFEDSSPRGLHLTANSVIDVDGDTATARSDWLFFQFAADTNSWAPFAGGSYVDHLARLGREWLFHRREDRLRGNLSLADLT
jgi:uncharacterized protein (TIGR02246 family)